MTSHDSSQSSSTRRWRFPRGAGALPRARFEEIQRARLFEATCVALAEEGGFAHTSVADILERAGMSNKTFYELFDNKEDCVLATFDACAAALGAELQPAWFSAGAWRERLGGAIAAALGFAAEAPLQARFLLLGAPTAGPALIAAQRAAGERLAEALRAASPTADRAAASHPGLGR